MKRLRELLSSPEGMLAAVALLGGAIGTAGYALHRRTGQQLRVAPPPQQPVRPEPEPIAHRLALLESQLEDGVARLEGSLDDLRDAWDYGPGADA